MGFRITSLADIQNIGNKAQQKQALKAYNELQREELRKTMFPSENVLAEPVIAEYEPLEQVLLPLEGKRSVSITLPYPPTINSLYASVMIKGHPRRIMSKEGKLFKDKVAYICYKQGVEKLNGEIKLEGRLYRPMLRGDASNRIKATEDALKGIMFDDDEQIAEIHIKRFLDRQNPRFELTFTEIDSIVELKRKKKG